MATPAPIEAIKKHGASFVRGVFGAISINRESGEAFKAFDEAEKAYSKTNRALANYIKAQSKGTSEKELAPLAQKLNEARLDLDYKLNNAKEALAGFKGKTDGSTKLDPRAIKLANACDTIERSSERTGLPRLAEVKQNLRSTYTPK